MEGGHNRLQQLTAPVSDTIMGSQAPRQATGYSLQTVKPLIARLLPAASNQALYQQLYTAPASAPEQVGVFMG